MPMLRWLWYLPCSCCHCRQADLSEPAWFRADFCRQRTLHGECVCESFGTKLEAVSTFEKTYWRQTGVVLAPVNMHGATLNSHRQACSHGFGNLLKHAFLDKANTLPLSRACLPLSDLFTTPLALQSGLWAVGTGVRPAQRPRPAAKACRSSLAQAGNLVQS